MFDFNQDVEEFSQSLQQVGLDQSLAQEIAETVADRLYGITSSNGIEHPELTNPQLMVIQQFLSKYSFHIQRDGEDWYYIGPNWN